MNGLVIIFMNFVSAEVSVQFSATMYTVNEGESANMTIELVGVSVMEIRVIVTTLDDSANCMFIVKKFLIPWR